MRAWKSVGGIKTYFLYDGDDPVCEMDASGNVTAVNTFGSTGLVSRAVGSPTAGYVSTFYAFDPQGSAAERVQ